MLSVKVITLRFDEVRGGYDDAVLNDFFLTSTPFHA